MRRSGPPVGRIEQALNLELRDPAHELTSVGARAHLRALARALDVAEAKSDLAGTAKVSREYLDARRAYGLAGGEVAPLDPFAAFVAGLSAPSLGDATDTE
jgi:hypothetical protein